MEVQANKEATSTPMNTGSNLFILSAPSATGKNAVFSLLSERIPTLCRVITATTRQPRKSEVHGVDYYFMTEAEFLKKASEGAFAEQNRYVEAYYGTPVSEIARYSSDTPLFLIVDTHGMKSIKAKYPAAVSIFLMPPSIDALIERIEKRGDNTEKEIQKRIREARDEIACAELYDYTVVNSDLNVCVGHVAEIVKRHMGF